MVEISVIRKLFKIGIISMVLNSYFLVAIIPTTILVIIYDTLASVRTVSKLWFFVAAFVEHSISILLHVLFGIVCVVGSCLGFMQQRGIRKFGLKMMIVSNIIFFILLLINVSILITSFVILPPNVISSSGSYHLDVLVDISLILMSCISIFHLTVFVYNSAYIVLVYKSCNQIIPA